MPDKPNIVLICVDQWRADCLSIAGHPAVETPHLDQLAHQGALFTNAFSATPTCIAARASLMTGTGQRTHGRVGYQDKVEATYPTTLAGEMTRGGYQTIACGKMHVHPQRNRIGFEEVILHDGMIHAYGVDRESDYEDWLRANRGADCGLFDHGIESNSWVARPWHLDEQAHPTYWVTSQATQWLGRRDKTKPFFMLLSYVAPHPPLVPPDFYLRQYLDQDLPTPAVGDWEGKLDLDGDSGRWVANTSCGRLDPRAQHRAQAGYYGLMTQIDHQIGRLLEHLSDHQLRDTVIMFTSDHGELMGDHLMFRKSMPYQGSAQVPLIVRIPGQTGINTQPGPRDQLVDLRDIMPTVLDIAGLEIPDSVEGKSLLGIIRGQSDQPVRDYLHGEHTSGRLSNHWISDGQWKYIWFSQSGVEQLFDCRNDPDELHDLAEDPDHHKTLKRLRGQLVKELTGREESYTDGEKLIVGQRPQPTLSHILP
jgi:arylsulfatase A-like enzyme